ncbi:MAG TPA: hypothetical protein PLS49_04810 [Candidatus Woesebacteria bacterium]|nr:hypothetical protein [Candidatus Woesebacteria bacterium]
MLNRKGEISTLVILGTLVVMGVAALLNSTLNNERKILNTEAAGSCPIVSINLEGSVCKVQINYTPGDPEPAAPKTLVCALINPARSSTIPNDQLLAGQGNISEYDFFNRTNTGSFVLTKEANFSTKLNPVPADGNYKLVAYDFTNPTSCLKEISIPATGIENRLNENTSNTNNTTQPTPIPTSSMIPTTPLPPTQTVSNTNTVSNSPTPIPTSITSCRSGQFRCLSGECVEFQDECPSAPAIPTIQPNLNPNAATPTPQTQLYLPLVGEINLNPTPIPTISNPKTQFELGKETILKACQQGGTLVLTSDCAVTSVNELRNLGLIK